MAKDLIWSWIKCDWTGDPPGEFIEIATAGAFFIEKAFLIISSWLAKLIPCLNFPTLPITPFNLIWGIIFFFFENWKHMYAYKIYDKI